MVLSSTYQSTDNPLLSTLYEPLSKHLITVLGGVCLLTTGGLIRVRPFRIPARLVPRLFHYDCRNGRMSGATMSTADTSPP
jgi:hypothetical protein